jgi:hypothetical protein
MAALQALRPAASGIVRNPILVLLTAVFGLSQLPSLLVPTGQPILASLVSLGTTGALILVLPFLQGGVLAMAGEAITGETNLGTLIAEGKANYVSLLLAYFVLLAINAVFGFFVFVGAFVAVIGGSVASAGSSPAGTGVVTGDSTVLAVIAIIALGAVLVYLLVTLFVQFYAHAIVLDDRDVVAGFRRSVGLVRSHLLSVVGYSLVLGVGSLLIGTLAAGASLVFGPRTQGSTALPSPVADLVSVEPTVAIIAVLAVAFLVLTGVFGAFYATYSVAFYESISRASTPEIGSGPEPESEPGHGPESDRR